MNATERELIELELRLHKPEIRASKEVLDELIADEF